MSEQMVTAKASYERCCAVSHFFEDFYRNFFVRCPQARSMFAQTDFEKQRKLLQHAFGLLLLFPNEPKQEPNILSWTAERHSRKGLGVHPSLYPAFIDALIDTVRQCDSRFTPAIEDAWRQTVQLGVDYMTAKY